MLADIGTNPAAVQSVVQPACDATQVRVLFTDRYPELSETFVAAEAPLFDAVEAVAAPATPGPGAADRLWTDDSSRARLAALAWLVARHPLGVARDLAARPRWRRDEDVPPLRFLAPAARRWRGAEHIHVHFAAGAALSALRLSRVLGVPYSLTAHGYDIFQRPANLAEKCAAAAFVTSGSAYTVSHVPGARLVPMGVDCEHFRRRAPHGGGRTVLAIGRLVPKKGFDVLVDAAAALDGAQVLIAGEGPERAALSARIAARGAPVRLLGAQDPDEVRRLLEHADVLCAPSVVAPDGDRDSMPVVIKEALAMEVTVVASDVAGLPEAVRPEFGTVVPAGDPDALAAALAAELARPAAEQAARGAAGRAYVCEHFSVDAQLAAMSALLDAGEGTRAGQRSP